MTRPLEPDLRRRALERAGLAKRVTPREGVALDVLSGLAGPYDLIFLDADRPAYFTCLEVLLPRLRPGGLLVTDNVVTHAHEPEEFLALLRVNPVLETVTVPLGNGQTLTYKKP